MPALRYSGHGQTGTYKADTGPSCGGLHRADASERGQEERLQILAWKEKPVQRQGAWERGREACPGQGAWELPPAADLRSQGVNFKRKAQVAELTTETMLHPSPSFSPVTSSCSHSFRMLRDFPQGPQAALPGNSHPLTSVKL